MWRACAKQAVLGWNVERMLALAARPCSAAAHLPEATRRTLPPRRAFTLLNTTESASGDACADRRAPASAIVQLCHCLNASCSNAAPKQAQAG